MVSSNYFDFVGHVINHDKSLSHCIAIKAAKHHAKIKLLDQILQFSEKMLQGEQLKISVFCKPRSKSNNHSRDSEITKQSSQENGHCPEALTIDSQFIRMGGQIDYVEYHCPVLQPICQLLQLLTDFLNGPYQFSWNFLDYIVLSSHLKRWGQTSGGLSCGEPNKSVIRLQKPV